jgi:CelD/BcsL family acetyltransferase involved in cellulose biosynthesis
VGPTEIATHPGELAGLVGEWRRLAAATPGTSYFLSPDWVLAWWETLGRGLPAEVAIWRDGAGGLEAVVGLVQVGQRLHRRVPLAVPTWTNLGAGAGAADHCGWAVLPGRAGDARAWIARKAAGAPLLLDHLDPDAGVPLLPAGARRVGVTACPRLALPPAGQEPPLPPSQRKRLGVLRRRLDRAGVSFRWVGCEQLTDALLDTVFDLHERRFSLLAARSSFTRDRAAFHRRLIARAGPGRGPALVLAERDGRAVGALYGLCWSEVFAYYQMGWEPELARASLGTALLGEAIRLAGTAGYRVFDLLRGAEPYKYRFGASDRVDETWLVPRGGGGRLLDLGYRVRAARRLLASASARS